MRCVRRKPAADEFSDPTFVLLDVEIPTLEENDILVEVKACGLSLVNEKILKEVFHKSSQETLSVGHDVSGIVTQVGPKVTSVKEGDEVVGVLPLDSVTSGCGQYCILREFDAVQKPSRVTHEVAAAVVGDAVRAYTALHYHTHVCAGDTVLIMDGATPQGSIAVQLAQMWGAKVSSTYSTLAEKQCLESVQPPLAQVLELSQRSTLLVSSIMEETGGIGVDCVVDNGVRIFTSEEDVALLGEKSKYPKPHKHDVIACLGFAGKWVTSHPDLQLDPPDCQQLFLRNASVSFLFPQAWTLMYAQHGRYQHILLDVMEKLDKGILKCKIVQTVSLDDTITILKNLQDVRVGKVVLKM